MGVVVGVCTCVCVCFLGLVTNTLPISCLAPCASYGNPGCLSMSVSPGQRRGFSGLQKGGECMLKRVYVVVVYCVGSCTHSGVSLTVTARVLCVLCALYICLCCVCEPCMHASACVYVSTLHAVFTARGPQSVTNMAILLGPGPLNWLNHYYSANVNSLLLLLEFIICLQPIWL